MLISLFRHWTIKYCNTHSLIPIDSLFCFLKNAYTKEKFVCYTALSSLLVCLFSFRNYIKQLLWFYGQ